MAFDIDVITTHWPILVEGFGVSVVVASGAFVLGLAAGSVVALMKLSSVPPLRWVAVAYIELFRNVPFLI